MKKTIYFLLIILGSALYSCSDQFDNIKQYATAETIYVGNYKDLPTVKIGYNRIEIDLMADSIGRVTPDEIHLGKARKTIVEFDESDGPRRRVFDSVCSWVNITELTTPKTYIFSIYTEDEFGNTSIPVEALGKPFTDDDLDGISFPLPYMIPTPTTMEFRWTEESGLSSSLFNFAELTYLYTDREGKDVSGKLSSKDVPRFSITGLNTGDNVPISVTCKIIPIMETGPILDTVTMVREFVAKTASNEEYLSARTLRPVESATIHNDDETKATIKWSPTTDHLLWTEIRYVHSDGTIETVRVENDLSETACTDIKRGERIQIRCAFNPPLTNDVFITEWANNPITFMIRHDRKNWVVTPRHGNHPWGSDGGGLQTLWDGGHPMLVLDDDPNSGWHSLLDSELPQLLIIDMKESRSVTQVSLYSTNGGYWHNIEFYLTDDLSMPGYTSHTVNWDWDKGSRQNDYSTWVTSMGELIPANPPAASWGRPIAKFEAKNDQSNASVLLPQTLQGQFLIVIFQDNNIGWGGTYIDVETVEVYSE